MPNHPDLVSGLGQHPVPQVTGMRRLSSCCRLPSPTPQMYKCLVWCTVHGYFPHAVARHVDGVLGRLPPGSSLSLSPLTNPSA